MPTTLILQSPSLQENTRQRSSVTYTNVAIARLSVNAALQARRIQPQNDIFDPFIFTTVSKKLLTTLVIVNTVQPLAILHPSVQSYRQYIIYMQ